MKKVIGFFSGDSQVGTTMVAQSFAELLVERGRKVLFILGSGKYGDEFVHVGMGHSIDDLKASIRSGRVDAEDLRQNLEKKRELWILPGVRNPLMAKYFPENTYEILLASAGADFDYVVIDGGCDAQLGVMISALNYCEERFFIITQQSKSIHRFIQFQKNILEPLKVEGRLVINKYLRDPALFLKGDILTLSERKKALIVPYVEYGWQAEMEGRTLLHFRKFAKGMEELVEIFEPKPEKEGLWKRNFA